AAQPRAKLSRRGLRWALEALVIQHLTVARVAESLGVRWNTANDAVLAEGKRLLINDPHRFDNVTTIGVDEHVWRHTRGGDKYVTVIIDLTPLRTGTGPARLLDMVEGRSKQVLKTWLAERDQAWRDNVEVEATEGFTANKTAADEELHQPAAVMDTFTGFNTAGEEGLPQAAAVMDPFHVVRLAGDAVEKCRRRVQLETLGHRGRKQDPLYKARRTLLTGADLLTDKQYSRIQEVFTSDAHFEVEATWAFYHHMVAAYREPDRAEGKNMMDNVITKLSRAVPKALIELTTLGRTLKNRATDILAYFDRPGTSNGPTEAING